MVKIFSKDLLLFRAGVEDYVSYKLNWMPDDEVFDVKKTVSVLSDFWLVRELKLDPVPNEPKIFERGVPEPTKVVYHIGYDGPKETLDFKPSSVSCNMITDIDSFATDVDSGKNTIVLCYDISFFDTKEALITRAKGDHASLLHSVEILNIDISKYNEEVKELASQMVNARKDALEKKRRLLS